MGLYECEQALKKSEEEVDLVKEKISKNQGEILLCSRELITGRTEGDIPAPHAEYAYHVEAGIISGEVEIKDLKESFSSRWFDVPGLMSSSHLRNSNYSYTPEIVVPVKRKLIKFIMEKERILQVNLYKM